jgi:hypothetical protein
MCFPAADNADSIAHFPQFLDGIGHVPARHEVRGGVGGNLFVGEFLHVLVLLGMVCGLNLY